MVQTSALADKDVHEPHARPTSAAAALGPWFMRALPDENADKDLRAPGAVVCGQAGQARAGDYETLFFLCPSCWKLIVGRGRFRCFSLRAKADRARLWFRRFG